VQLEDRAGALCRCTSLFLVPLEATDEGRPAGLKQREEEVHPFSDVGVHRERNIYGAQGPNPGAGG
jgi:hypothetical protein